MRYISIIKFAAILIFLIWFSGCATYRIQQGADAYSRGDFDEAMKQWVPYAKDGNYYAQYNVGIIWEQGLGNTPLNPDQAIAWYLLSAKQGYFPAMVRLANLQRLKGYETAAESWLVLAARWGNSEAVAALRAWGKEVPDADLLAQQQYNNAIENQKIIDATVLALIYVLNGVVTYQSATHYQPLPQPVSHLPTTHNDSRGNRTPGYQTKDAFGNFVNSNSSYQTRDAFGNIVNSNSNFQTKDYLGNIVNSSSCYEIKDSFGNLVQSTGCSK